MIQGKGKFLSIEVEENNNLEAGFLDQSNDELHSRKACLMVKYDSSV
jgi:hypothetical protein